jgi:aryl-alcohol dehydrogenase-like predicted oxidoreductase
LSYPEVSSVIPGMRKPAHVSENISLSDKGSLGSELLAELRKHAWPRDFYTKNFTKEN